MNFSTPAFFAQELLSKIKKKKSTTAAVLFLACPLKEKEEMSVAVVHGRLIPRPVSRQFSRLYKQISTVKKTLYKPLFSHILSCFHASQIEERPLKIATEEERQS
jgi:hypothetical protein